MRILILDTATERGITALIENGKERFSIELPFGLQNSHHLLPKLERVLNENEITCDQMDLIGVSIGPGSYTGIRIGTMVAKTLAYSCKIPMVGICTLDGFLPNQDGIFAVLIDAKIGGIYLQKGCLREGKVDRLLGPIVAPFSDVIGLLGDVPLLVSPHAYPLRMRLPSESSFIWHECAPSALRLAEIAEFQFNLGNYSKDGHIDLLYMRKTQAEMERAQNAIFPS